MLHKEDELIIIGVIDEDRIEGHIMLKEIKSVFFDLVQVGPMFRYFVNLLE